MAGNTKKPRIVFFDLETLPNLPEALKVWPQLSNYPGLTLKATITSIICAGYKVLDSEKVKCINAWDFKNWQKNINDDSEVCKAIHKVLETADAVVTHNGKRFDWKFLQTRLMYHGLEPLAKIPHIDTVQVARQHLLSFNNKLGTLGKWLISDDKIENGGWSLWVDVHNNDKKAKKLMSEYCCQDVLLLEKVFKKLKPFISNIPNYNLFIPNSKILRCPNCGSTKLRDKGYSNTKIISYKRYHCKECNTYCRTNLDDLKPRTF